MGRNNHRDQDCPVHSGKFLVLQGLSHLSASVFHLLGRFRCSFWLFYQVLMEAFAQSFYGRAEVYLSSVGCGAGGEAHARISPENQLGTPHSLAPSPRGWTQASR